MTINELKHKVHMEKEKRVRAEKEKTMPKKSC